VTQGLELDVASPVATLWLDRENKRNAVSASMWAALPELARTATADHSIRVLVVRGKGDHFCAGADISELGTSLAADGAGQDYRATNARAEAAIRDAPVVTVAAIDGSCMGGGVQLALACDLRVATRRARIGITAGRLGISFPATSLERLVEVVGAGVARRLLVTAEVLGADDAKLLGLVDHVVDDDALDGAVTDLCGALVATSAVTQLAAKEMIAQLSRTGAVDVELAESWERASATSPDLIEGLTAFGERRAPLFGPRPGTSDH
jgi:enoyl-CoA hydratase/carnithine racemase